MKRTRNGAVKKRKKAELNNVSSMQGSCKGGRKKKRRHIILRATHAVGYTRKIKGKSAGRGWAERVGVG